MDIKLFDFELPEDRIALRPIKPRDAAKLLVVRPGGVEDQVFTGLAGLLQPGDILVFNNTKVIPARLLGKIGNGKAEATLLKPVGVGKWTALARPAKRFKPGIEVDFDCLKATVISTGEGGEVTLDFGVSDISQLLDVKGKMPLPPYIAKRREVDAQDRADYQTIYASIDGAVAAPTAGLHFTKNLLESLAEKGIKLAYLTLHVGAGTFLPVKVDNTDDHKMHPEWGEILPDTADAINAARANGARVVAVGTTALRLLESAAGNGGIIHPFTGETDIFITPGYEFKAVDLLLTNFHLPKSTLFMLVSAFSGLTEMKAAYAHAIDSCYRFYSYGDGCLLHLKERA